MNIFIYSDESGVFDKFHNTYFVFGGLMFLSKQDRDIWSRKYISVERMIRQIENKSSDFEVKASAITNKSKLKLYRSLNQVEKFGIIIEQKTLFNSIFADKKTKQRYLDWAYKMAVKTKFLELMKNQQINPNEVKGIYLFIDEHTTATNGIYELQESLEQEFKNGMYSGNWLTFYEPIFPNLETVKVKYCDSKTKILIRAADIISNHIYHQAITNNGVVERTNKLSLYFHP